MPGTRVLALAIACALAFLVAPAPRRPLAARAIASPPPRVAAPPTPAVTPAIPIAQSPSPPRPVTLYLHGICGNPNNGCPYFRDGVEDTSVLLCPRAPVACSGGRASWGTSFTAQRATVNAALERATHERGDAVDARAPGVLIGFSQGAYVAESLVRNSPGRFRAVAYVGAFVRPDAESLRAAGVRRVLFAAGERDMTYRAMRAAATRLEAQGFPVRFLDLGPVGHSYVPAAGTAGWHDALAWLEAG